MDCEADYLKFREAVLQGKELGALGSDELTELLNAHYNEHGPEPNATEDEKKRYQRWKIKLRRHYHQESKKWMKSQADLPKVVVKEVDTLISEMDKISKETEESRKDMEKHVVEQKEKQKELEEEQDAAESEGPAPKQPRPSCIPGTSSQGTDRDGTRHFYFVSASLSDLREMIIFREGMLVGLMFAAAAIMWAVLVKQIFALLI